MKYITILIDGAADYHIEEINGTPLSVAYKPYMDELSQNGEIGLCKTVPDGMKPGSDTANLSVMGYDPRICYTGRSPLEAVSMGIVLSEKEVTYRANLVTLSDDEEYQNKTMLDYSGGEISTEESAELISFLAKSFDSAKRKLHSGISYRHCLVEQEMKEDVESLVPPHDITDKKITEFLPKNEEIKKMMEESYNLLKGHKINLERVKQGKKPANSLWIWGMGTKPKLENFENKYGVKGGVISAVDLIKGIGILGEMKIIEVENITGNMFTNFRGKAEKAIEELKGGLEFVYLHIEAPDECGHQGNLKSKIQSIEIIDREIVSRIVEYLRGSGEEYKIVIAPDHPTPIALKTHTSDSVPYIYYDSSKPAGSGRKYNEKEAKESGISLPFGEMICKKLFER